MIKKKYCEICNKDNFSLLSKKIREGNCNVFFCKNCQLGILEEKKFKEETKLYKKNKSNEILSKERLESYKKAQILSEVNSIYNFKDKDVIEIGPGLAPLTSYYFKTTKSNFILEKNKFYARFLKKKYKRKLKIVSKENLNSFNKKFDLCIMVHVFEHLSNPIHYLKLIEKLLKKGGSLILILPNLNDVYLNNLNSLQKKKYLEFNLHHGHKFYYTLNSLKKLINKYTKLRVNLNSTFQEYSVNNFFSWNLLGKGNSNFSSAIDHNLENDDLDLLFKSYCKKNKIGSSIILKASK